MKQQIFGIVLVVMLGVMLAMPQSNALESTVTGVNTQGNSQVYKRLQQFVDGKIDQLKRRLQDLTNREDVNRTFIEAMSGRCSSGEAVTGINSSGSIQCDPVVIEWLDVYHWDAGEWGTCSETCGGGTQNRVVTCRNQNNQIVADSNCDGAEPDTSRDCNIDACPIGECSWEEVDRSSGQDACPYVPRGDCHETTLEPGATCTEVIGTGQNCDGGGTLGWAGECDCSYDEVDYRAVCDVTTPDPDPSDPTPPDTGGGPSYTYSGEIFFTAENVMADCDATTKAMPICGNVSTGDKCALPGLCVTRITGRRDPDSIWGGGGCAVYTRICE